ncbi:MAG: response regulator transcription factor, partial [Verrucomicrobia subdivision 3 bacterium]|nr:response regulator transcription factor [Limisphaerales bacterium]
EDEPQMRKNICTILELEGFRVSSAENGRLGVEQAKTARPDLILCDVMMPELDGYGVLEQLRDEKQTATVPFIFLTAKGEKKDFRAGMNLGADDYLAKPCMTEDLLAAISARLQRQQDQEEYAQWNQKFRPNFESPAPLQRLGLTPREAEVLCWVAQGKTNPDVAVILGMSEGTVKKHLEHIFEKIGVESRHAATFCALEVLGTAR